MPFSWLAWLGFFQLNLGLILRAVFEIGMTQGIGRGELVGWGLIIAGLLQWGGVTAWIMVNWGRVKERGGK